MNSFGYVYEGHEPIGHFSASRGPKTHIWPKRAKMNFSGKKSPVTIWALQMYTKYKKIRKIQWFTKAGVKCAYIPIFLS